MQRPQRQGPRALILYTSGTTGKPKGALFDHHRVMWASVNFVAACGMRVGDRFLHVAPLYHAAELGIMLMPGTMIGATHVVLPGFDPGKVLDVLESERITMLFGVPTMFQFLLRQPEATRRDLSAWRTGLLFTEARVVDPSGNDVEPGAVGELIHHFATKLDVIVAVITQGADQLLHSTARALADTHDDTEALDACSAPTPRSP